MMTFRITKFAALLLLLIGVRHPTCSADDRLQAQRFFNAFCVSCHGPESPEAGIRLDKIDAEHWKEFSLLEDIYAVLESGEMPPEDAPTQPEQLMSDG